MGAFLSFVDILMLFDEHRVFQVWDVLYMQDYGNWVYFIEWALTIKNLIFLTHVLFLSISLAILKAASIVSSAFA